MMIRDAGWPTCRAHAVTSPSTCRALPAQRRPRDAARTRGHGGETPANQDTDVVRGSDKVIPQAARPVSADRGTAHRADTFSKARPLLHRLGHDEGRQSATEEQGAEHKGGDGMSINRAKIILCASALVVLAQTTMTPSAQAQILTGDARLACEALVCLSAVGPPPRGMQQGVG
ncbi:MAG: hypothetical protein ABI988_13720 [Nitrospirota bacterium]